ncbi:hypothetical protein [Dysgonomonas termitidis]|uniref:Uncharacterized protein n=1 Tax=Dysgonomonas termitidis TaxID=1516126 RepID=A0ABV9KRC1_9BACT
MNNKVTYFNHICYKVDDKYHFGDIITFSCKNGIFHFCLKTKTANQLFISLKGENIIYIV